MKQYIYPFIKVCKNVFLEFIGQQVDAKVPYFLEKEETSEWDISAIIGLTGEARGAVVISMKEELALRVTTKLTGLEYKKLDDDVVDAIGEIVNIIAGNVKQELEDAFRLVISLPTIVRGKEHTVNWKESQARIICIPFTVFDSDSFTLSVALEAVKDS
ncbi:MAG: chemotaxis protein CheX [Treponema sp.]|nr:chemotaxis protein CheX [Treponema sp.]